MSFRGIQEDRFETFKRGLTKEWFVLRKEMRTTREDREQREQEKKQMTKSVLYYRKPFEEELLCSDNYKDITKEGHPFIERECSPHHYNDGEPMLSCEVMGRIARNRGFKTKTTKWVCPYMERSDDDNILIWAEE